MSVDYDVIVVGAGHAGSEAAVMAARLGTQVLLLTSNLDTIGQMSCNPAIGGIAKGTVVREIDALGGIMGRATDRATIQFRMLNRSKGPAVWAPRAQCDRTLFRRAVRELLEGFPGIELTQGMVTRLILDGPRVAGDTRAVEYETRDHPLGELDARKALKQLPHRAAEQCAIALRPGRPDGGALGAIEHAELDRRAIGRPPHDTAEGVDLADHRALRDPADGGIAGHLTDGVEVGGKQENLRTQASRHDGGFGAGVAGADDDDVVVERHARNIRGK